MSGSLQEEPPAAKLYQISVGESWDKDSNVNLYHADGHSTVQMSPEMNAINTVVLLRETAAPSIAKSGRRRVHQPSGALGDAGTWDMRQGWAADVGRVSAVGFAMSLGFLDGMQSGPRKQWASVLGADKDGFFSDEILMGLSFTAAAALRSPCSANTLLLSHVFAAAATRLAFRGGFDLDDLAGANESLPHLAYRAKEFMASNLDSDVSLADVAAACGVPLPYLARAFRKVAGISPYRWLMQERINRAKGLLSIPGNTLVGVALECGFANQSHFTRCFSQVAGISPGQWRRLHGWGGGKG